MKNSFLSAVKKQKRNSIFYRTMKNSVLFILIPVIITGVCLLTYNSSVISEKTRTYHKDAHTRIQKVWDNISNSITNINSIINIEKLLNVLTNTSSYQSGFQLSYDSETLTKILSNSIYPTRYISSIYLYNEKTDYILSTSGSGTRSMFWDENWYSGFSALNESESSYYRSFDFNRQTLEYISVVHRISTVPECCAVYNIDYRYLKSELQSAASTIGAVYITDPRGRVMFSYNKDDIGKDIKSVTEGVSEKYLMVSSSDTFGLYTVRSKTSDFPTKNYSYFIFGLVCLVIISCTASSVYTSKTFSKSVAKVIMAIPTGDEPDNAGGDEFSFIIDRISDLFTENSKFEQELAAQLSKLKTSQIQALQEQINPHFIFNTLNLISLIDLSEDKPEHSISKIVSLLSDILRFITDTEEYMVSVKTEIDYLKKYIELQNIKYENKFRVEWNISEAAENMRMVKFSLQPLVENAIMHGFVRKSADNVLSVKVFKQNEKLIAEVSNNGEPISAAGLSELRRKLKNGTPSHNGHIGLLNVNLRYMLIFGDDYSCTVTSEKTTKIRLAFPAIKKPDFKPHSNR